MQYSAGETMKYSQFTKWRFELYPTLAQMMECYQNIPKYPNIERATEVVGFLTDDGNGLCLDTEIDLSEGYYVVPAVNYHSEGDRYYDFCYMHGVMLLFYMSKILDEPRIIGFFPLTSWEEVYVDKNVKSATFRIPARLLDEFKSKCEVDDVSQTSMLTNCMWNVIRGERGIRGVESYMKQLNGGGALSEEEEEVDSEH